MDARTRTALEGALTEAEVVGPRRAASGSACEPLLHVCAQPAAGWKFLDRSASARDRPEPSLTIDLRPRARRSPTPLKR